MFSPASQGLFHQGMVRAPIATLCCSRSQFLLFALFFLLLLLLLGI
jgi:hypothetical protein